MIDGIVISTEGQWSMAAVTINVALAVAISFLYA
jgi:hypothetical protein